ncbi:hypothetical protein GX586_12760 [bacterium]|nr:hypothetical protein [bacterium]
MNDTITKLLHLQEVDAETYRLQQQRSDIPKQLRAAQAAYQLSVQQLEDEQAKRTQLVVESHRQQLEVDSAEERIKALQRKQSEVRKNQEYQALSQEIRVAELHRTKLQTALQDQKSLIESLDGLVAGLQKNAEEQKRTLLQQAMDAKKQLEEIQRQVSAKRALRRSAMQGIDAAALQTYERLMKCRAPYALVTANRNVCSGCNINLPPQVIADITKGDRLVICENCSRILYLEPGQ